jgi:hypothetical protein
MGLLWSIGDDWMTSEPLSILIYWSRVHFTAAANRVYRYRRHCFVDTMNTVAMLALEFVGIAVAVILIALRLILLLRQPYHTKLEILGAASMILGCLVSIYFMATFCQQGIQILHWFSQGYSETEIRAKLSVPRYLKMVFSADLTTVTALWLPKVSMLAAYAPAYRGFHQKLKILFRVTIAVTALTYLGSMVVFIFYCFPVSMNW